MMYKRINAHVKENRFVEENPEFQKDYEEIKRKRENKIAEDAAKAIDNNLAEDSSEATADAAEDKKNKGCLIWAIVVLVIIGLLLGHIIWCLTHHMDDQPAEQTAVITCHICNKQLDECKCAENIGCTVCGLSEQDCTCKNKIKDLESLALCETCGEPRLTGCSCRVTEETESEGDEHICTSECEVHCPKAECSGNCPVHCPDEETQEPVVEQQKPTTQQKPSKQESTPEKKPIKIPGIGSSDDDDECDEDDNKPESKPSQPSKPADPTPSAPCEHKSTKEVEGKKETASDGEWSQKVELVCTKCGEVIDYWYRGGVVVDIMVPDVNNEGFVDDDGEAASPVS